MPMSGIEYVPRQELMTYEEMSVIIRAVVGLGIEKLRITGGEPFLRKDIVDFMEEMSRLEGLSQIHITTNGTLTAPFVPQLRKMGINSVNLSLDTLDAEKFFTITRKKEFDKVMATFEALLSNGIRTKINAVVMQGRNEDDIVPLATLTKEYPVDVRFIEEMPFNGEGAHNSQLYWTHERIHERLRAYFPEMRKIPDPPYSTSSNFEITGHKGKIGIIAAFSRTFCGACNRIRLTPQGVLKTCLYDSGVFNLKNLLRQGASVKQLQDAVSNAVLHKAKDGFEAEESRFGASASESMATIGG
jgi:cyclic pyranopterin phosphate synthase